MKMTPKKWKAMTSQERYDFLSAGDLKIKTITGLDGSAKVNSDHPVITSYVASVGGVTLSHPWESREQAVRQAENNIAHWKAEAAK